MSVERREAAAIEAVLPALSSTAWCFDSSKLVAECVQQVVYMLVKRRSRLYVLQAYYCIASLMGVSEKNWKRKADMFIMRQKRRLVG
jgi:hypothetical protein